MTHTTVTHMTLTEARRITSGGQYHDKCEVCRRMAAFIVWGQTQRPRGACTCKDAVCG